MSTPSQKRSRAATACSAAATASAMRVGVVAAQVFEEVQRHGAVGVLVQVDVALQVVVEVGGLGLRHPKL
jgi:hypothetical protein